MCHSGVVVGALDTWSRSLRFYLQKFYFHVKTRHVVYPDVPLHHQAV